MSKRFIYPQQSGERKKARLNVSLTDHNFPLSQNPGPSRETNENNWGDDNDDEILLLASQACEDAYNDISSLPDYSMCMQPPSTSTQLCAPTPSTSKAEFSFKMPNTIPSNLTTANLKDKCNRIASPLPGLSTKVLPKDNQRRNMSDDPIFDAKYRGEDYVYKQFLQLQEENEKLKSENGKLLEKCVTKEGEASILRTQLKSCQSAVDNARLERIKAQEKVQGEWADKLAVVNGQVHDLRTQLDFKNLEIISIKERCKLMESNKIRLTQVTVAHNDISSSHRNNSVMAHNSSSFTKKVKTSTNAVQTDTQAHFLKLHVSHRSEPSKITTILPLTLQSTEEEHSLLEYNEKLQRQADQRQCKVFTFNRISSTSTPKENKLEKVELNDIYQDLMAIMQGDHDKFSNIISATHTSLLAVQSNLQAVHVRAGTAFFKAMDEKHLEPGGFVSVRVEKLISGRCLYKEEQAILARRMLAVVYYILDTSRSRKNVDDLAHHCNNQLVNMTMKLIDVMSAICNLMDVTSCAYHYSGLLLCTTKLLCRLPYSPTILNIVKSIISSRPMLFVSCQVLKLIGRLISKDISLSCLCPGNSSGNLKTDYEQGVLLFKKDSCHLQILLKQIEVYLKSAESNKHTNTVISMAQSLVCLVTKQTHGRLEDVNGCECDAMLYETLVFALRICATLAADSSTACPQLLPTCISGIRQLLPARAPPSGQMILLCQILRTLPVNEHTANILSELSSSFQCFAEDATISYHRDAWRDSFQRFTITD